MVAVTAFDQWAAAAPPVVLAHVERIYQRPSDVDRPKGALSPLSTLSACDLYCYLQSRFGPANGIVMHFREDDSSTNLYHWQYTITCGSIILDIQSTQNALEVWAWGEAARDIDWKEFELRLQAELDRSKRSISEVKRRLERWKIFVNPYRRLTDVITELGCRLGEVSLNPPSVPSHLEPTDESVLAAFYSSVEEHGKQLVQAQTYGLSARLIVPIWVESFVNALMFLLAKKTIKEDERLYESNVRQQIDVRVKMLNHVCDWFDRQIDASAAEFKAMQRLFNLRNELLHGNIDPKKLAVDEVFFDGKIPLFLDGKGQMERYLLSSTKLFDPQAAQDAIFTGSEFIIFVMNHVDRRVREEMWMILDDPLPGFRPETGRIGRLFNSQIITMLPVAKPKRGNGSESPLTANGN